MPGPLIKPSKQFPGLQMLPEGVQRVIETIFPPDDTISPAMPGTAVMGKSAISALRPLSGSIDEVMKLIRADRQGIGTTAVNVPEGFFTADLPSQALVQQLKGPVPKVDPLKILAGEKLSSRPPKMPLNPTVPNNFYFANRQYSGRPPGSHLNRGVQPSKRDPLVEEMAKRYQVFDKTQKKASGRR